ncbi:MAG: DNA polymerase III, partial [Rhodospirillaceae bacterium]|nr:DNA polymerase III [Rhodospirillales bacterium]
PNLPVGTQITVRIAGVNQPQAQAAPGGMPPQMPGAVPTNPAPTAQPIPGQPIPGQPAAPAQLGAPAPGMAQQPTPFTAAPSTATLPPLLSGTVTAQPPGGHAVVQTPVGTLAVSTQMELQVGTPLTLEVVGKPVPPPPTATVAPASTDGLTAQGWPNFTQATNVLAASNQTQALEQLLRIMPQAGPRLAASMAMFAGALRSGEVRALVPENSVRGLEKAGKKELAQKLTADLGALSEDAARPLGNGEWRGFTMPFLNGATVDPIQLFVRATDEEAKRKGGSGNDERFVLDIKLSQLGRVQMDGLVRREDKLFDLIIRTDAPLPLEAKRDILGIFTNASELVGTKGTVVFQSGARWVDFPPAPPAPTRLEV